MRRVLLVVCLWAACVSGGAAQWLNYKTPGVPRTRDGKPRLNAPSPRTSDGHPDLTGVWMHELTSVAEVRRLFGAFIDNEIKVDAPGMEIGTQHKYAFNILVDFKPGESPIRPEAAKRLQERLAHPPDEDLCDPALLTGFPLAGLLSEPIKIVQAPQLTMI